jgi:hypothetical protein
MPLYFSLFIHFDFFHIFLGLSSFFSPIHSLIHLCFFFSSHIFLVFIYVPFFHLLFHSSFSYIFHSDHLFSFFIFFIHPLVPRQLLSFDFSLHPSFGSPIYLFIGIFSLLCSPIYLFILCSVTHHLFFHFLHPFIHLFGLFICSSIFFTLLSIYLVFLFFHPFSSLIYPSIWSFFVHPFCSFIILGGLYT